MESNNENSSKSEDSSVWDGTGVPSWIPDDLLSDPEHNTILQHLFKSFQGMHELQRTTTLCDVVIKVQDTTFHAHKVVLAATSKYFQAMLTSDFQESHQSEVSISGDYGNVDTFKVLLDFAYSGFLSSLTMATVLTIMDMAHYLQFDYAMERCVDFLLNIFEDATELDVKVALDILNKANLFGLKDLQAECKDYLAKNFRVSDKFVAHMTSDLMKEMLERLDLTDEKEVFDATLAWLKYDWESRKTMAPSLFRKIRLGIVPVGHLSMTLWKSPDLYAIPECKQLVSKTLNMIDAKQPNDQPLRFKEPSLFSTRTTVNAILFIGKTSVFYDVQESSWVVLKKCLAQPKAKKGAVDSCCNAEGILYVAKQVSNSATQPQFVKFDDVNNKWQTLAPMLERRQATILVYMNGKIYAIGGNQPRNNSCQEYDIKTNCWQWLSQLPTSYLELSPSSCIAHNGMILVYAAISTQLSVGHMTDYHLDLYNPDTSSWSVFQTFSHPAPSSVCGLVTTDGKCYRVVGVGCECTDETCVWHKVNVHEVVIDYADRSASIGDPQDQVPLDELDLPAFLESRAFLIKDELYAYINGNILKIEGSSGDQLVGLNELDRNYPPTMTTMFTFDKSKYGGKFLHT